MLDGKLKLSAVELSVFAETKLEILVTCKKQAHCV